MRWRILFFCLEHLRAHTIQSWSLAVLQHVNASLTSSTVMSPMLMSESSSASGISASAGGSGLFRVVLKCSLHLFSLTSYSVMSWFCPSASLWTCTKFSCPSFLLLFPLLLQDVRHAAICLVLLKSLLLCPSLCTGLRFSPSTLVTWCQAASSWSVFLLLWLSVCPWISILTLHSSCMQWFLLLLGLNYRWSALRLPEVCWSDSSKQSFLIAQTFSLATSKRWSLLSPIFDFLNLRVCHK